MDCPSCGAANGGDARFCLTCGRDLRVPCVSCGRPLEPGARFCPACGTAQPSQGPHEERKIVSVVFADVTGFTALGQSLDPEVLRSVMARYFDRMRAAVESHGGVVEKFIGDAVVAIFGAPQAREDDVERALGCALDMRAGLERLNHVLEVERGLRLRLRIGVSTGDVLAAAGRPGEGLVTGDAVTLAARLEETAEPGQIVASERTARAGRSFRFTPLGPRAMKGRTGTEYAFELVGRAEHPAEAPSAALVGRDAPMDALVERYDHAVSTGTPGLVTVYGDPGVGKSRLAAELTERLASTPVPPRVLWGRCRPPGEAGVYAPMSDLLKSEVGILDSDPAPVALYRLRTVLERRLADHSPEERARTVSALAFSMGLDDPARPFADLPPRQVRYEVHGAWRNLLDALVAERPVLGILDDLHWADHGLLDLIDDLLERVRGPMSLVCLARPELATTAPGWGRGPGDPSEMTLEPLGPSDAARLVAALIPGGVLPGPVLGRVLERAEGNPFFLEEIVRGLADQGLLDARAGGGARDLRESLEVVPIPDTVQAVIAARIDLLEPEDKRAIQLASVAGPAVWPGLLSRLLETDRDRIVRSLERLGARALIVARTSSSVEGEPEYAFKHVLIEQVAYDSLPRRARMVAHARVAEWLEETLGDRQREAIDSLASHYEAAYRAGADDPGAPAGRLEELRTRAVSTLLAGSAEARAQLALDAAERLAMRALELTRSDAERADALEALGETALHGYQGDRAWSFLTAAADARVAGAPDDGVGIARVCARALESPTRWGTILVLPSEKEAARYLELGLRNAGTGDSEERVRLLTYAGVWPLAFGPHGSRYADPEDARRDGEEAVDMAERLGRADLESAALDGLSTYWYSRGRFRETQAIHQRRLALVPRLEDLREIEDVYAMAARGAFHQGRYTDAFALASEGVRRVWHVSPLIALHALEWRALARFELGDWDGFLADMAQGEAERPDREEESQPGWRRRPWAAAALLHSLRGDEASAERSLARMTPYTSAIGAQTAEPAPEAPWLARLLARQGRADEALAVSTLPTVPYYREDAGLLQAARCEVLAAVGWWDAAPDVIAAAREEASVGGLDQLPAHADRLAGRIAAAAGDDGGAVELLGRAAVGFAAMDQRWELARTRLDLGQALRAAGRDAEAVPALRLAESVFAELGSVGDLAATRGLLDEIAAHDDRRPPPRGKVGHEVPGVARQGEARA